MSAQPYTYPQHQQVEMAPAAYGSAPGQPPATTVIVHQSYPETARTSHRTALITGILQVVIATILFFLSMAKQIFFVLPFGYIGYIGSVQTLMSGSFGIVASFKGEKCPSVTSMIFGIFGSITLFIGIVLNSIMTTAYGFAREAIRANRRPESSPLGEFAAAVVESGYVLSVLSLVCCLLNFLAALIQSCAACSLTCCVPRNRRVNP